MQTSIPNPQIDSNSSAADEISLHDVIREFRIWRNLIRLHWKRVLLCGAVGAAIGFIYAYLDKPVYTANTRFMLKNEGVGSLFGGQMTGLTSLLGGGQMGTPLERTAEVIASDRIVGRALLRSVKVRDTADLVINHFIRLSGIRKKWAKDSMLHSVSFRLNEYDVMQLSLSQRKAYKQIKSLMISEKGNGVVNKSFDKKSGVLTVSCIHPDEAFAIALSEAIYSELTQFFIDQMAFTATTNAEVMKTKLDSIQRELDAVRRGYARQTDQSLGLLLQQDKVNLKALAVKEQMLNVMYAEAAKNYEGFRFVNQAAMPSLTLIEAPYSPLAVTRRSKSKYIIIWSVFFFLSYIIGIRVHKFYNDNIRNCR